MSKALSQDQIDALIAATSDEPTTAAMPAAPVHAAVRQRRQVRTMDFARPSKFNKDQLRTLQMLHEAFCRKASTYLSGTVRSLAELNVSGAEQVPYGDYAGSLPVPTLTAVLELVPLGTNAMISIDLPLVFGMLDRMLGGPGTNTARVRELSEIEMSLATSLLERLLAELSSAWSELVDVQFRLRGIEMNAQFAQIAAASEPTVLVSLDVSIGTGDGSMAVCIPYRSIEKVVGNLTAHRYFSGGEVEHTDTRKLLLQNLNNVAMPVRAVIGEVTMPVDKVLTLKPGDAIPLGRKVDEGVQLVIGSTHAYRAVPGREGRHAAVRVVERLDHKETL